MQRRIIKRTKPNQEIIDSTILESEVKGLVPITQGSGFTDFGGVRLDKANDTMKPYVKKVKRDVVKNASNEIQDVCDDELVEQRRLTYEDTVQLVATLRQELDTLKKKFETQEKEMETQKKKIDSLEKESNDSMAIHILQSIDTVGFNQMIIMGHEDLRSAFKANVKRLASGTTLKIEDFQMFEEFRTAFPYNVNFLNYFSEKRVQPENEISDTEYITWLCSQFRTLNNQTTNED